jgi:hypothetical protein
MPSGPSQWIDHARLCVKQALQRWNAADLASIDDSRQLLEQSVTAVKMAIDLLRNGDLTVTGRLQPAIASLRRDISTMVRLVDACSAFNRGLTLRLGAALPPYDATGKTVGDVGADSVHGVVG